MRSFEEVDSPWHASHITQLRQYLNGSGPDREQDLPLWQIKFFVDDNGMFGFVPEGVIPGDMISETDDRGEIRIMRLSSSGPKPITTTRVEEPQRSKEDTAYPGWPHLAFVTKETVFH
jgi:hypothetical protein